jgi:hypothetical protein
MPTKRTTRERHRKAAPAHDPETVALFAELERVPLSRRRNESLLAKEDGLAWRLGLHAESRFDAQRVNDQTLLDCPPAYDFLVDGWQRVTAMRKTLLELAGLKPDPPLFWCRICGKVNTSAAAIRTRQCAACHNVDYVRRREPAGMTGKVEAS